MTRSGSTSDLQPFPPPASKARAILDDWADPAEIPQGHAGQYRRALEEMERSAWAWRLNSITKRSRRPCLRAADRATGDNNGQGNGLSRDRPAGAQVPAGPRIRHFRGSRSDVGQGGRKSRAHGLRHPVLPRATGPVNNQIPDWNDLVYNGDRTRRSATCTRPTTSRMDRAHLPGAMRGGVYAQFEDIPVAIKTVEQAIADKAYETGHIRPIRRSARRQDGRHHRVGTGGHGGGAAARPHRPRRMSERESRPGGLMLWHSDQDREALCRPARRADAGRGRDVPLRRQCRCRQDRGRAVVEYDAVLYCGGSETPRPAGIPGADL